MVGDRLFTEQTAAVSLNSINRQVSVMKIQ
jgi:hypothetical protein